MTWLWLAGFFLVQMGLGIWASRSIGTEEDYFVAGRRLGTFVLTLSLFATWFGAETCLGASGAVYASGLSGARADPLGYALCLLLTGLFLARRFSSGGYVTLGDLYRRRYGVPAERLAVLILVPSSLIWGAAQVRAFGQVLAVTGDLDVDTAIIVSATIVIAYTFVGGLMGDVVTDVVQGTVLAVGLFVVLAFSLGSVSTFDGSLSQSRLSLVPAGESFLAQLDRWSVPVLGSLVAQELIARVLAARSPAVAQRASLAACGLYLAVGAVPIALGLVGPSILPGLADPEQLLPSLSERFLPHALHMVFACALMAAILSTIDSILLSSSALLSHNVLVPGLKITSESAKVWVGRMVVVGSGVFAYVVAIHADSVYGLVETASTFGTAGILVVTIAALYDPRGSGPAAVAALIVGLVTTPIALYAFPLSAPFLTSVFLSSLTYLVVSRSNSRRGS